MREKQGRQVKGNAEKEDRKLPPKLAVLEGLYRSMSVYPRNLAHLAMDVSKQLHDRKA